jgi:SAM-dependent methyltransferase
MSPRVLKQIKFKQGSLLKAPFLDPEVPALVKKVFQTTHRPLKVVDVGCGIGRISSSLLQKHNTSIKIVVGVDISLQMCKEFKANVRDSETICAEACWIPFFDECFDFVICSALIEHVEDEIHLIGEISRILKDGGWLYLSTDLKKKYALYFYRDKDGFKLDPDHKREYCTVHQVTHILDKKFLVKDIIITPMKFSIAGMIVRALAKFSLIRLRSDFYCRHPRIRHLCRMTSIPLIGWYQLEILCKKRKI